MNTKNTPDQHIDKIEYVLQEKIRPSLALHNGDIRISSFEDGILSVKLIGQCMGCAWANSTMDSLVKKELMEAVPEIKDVVLDDSLPQDMLDFAKKILNNEI